MDSLLEKLSQPFPPKYIDWKPGATKGDRCMALAYADLRVYQDRLDEICGLDWSVRYVPWSDGRIICELTINGITRSSTGEMSASEEKGGNGGTVAEAQAMKRACAMFGLGRFLYELPSVWVDFDANAKAISKAGMADLDRRYREWYAKAIAATHKAVAEQPQPQPQQEEQIQHRNVPAQASKSVEPDNPFEDEQPTSIDGDPTPEELAIMRTWSGPLNAQIWAKEIGACQHEEHARKSWLLSVKACGGYTDKNKATVFLHFLRHQHEKLGAALADPSSN